MSNTVIQVGGKFGGTVLGILTVAVLTRHLGQAGYGQFVTATSFLQFFGILADFGLTLTLLRMISRPEADETRLASNVFTLRLASATVFFGGAALLALAFPYPPAVKAAIAVGSLSFFMMSLTSVLSGVFQKHLATAWSAIAEVSGRAALFVGVLLAARLGYGLLAAIMMLVLGNLIQFSINLAFVRRLVPFRLAFHWPTWKRIITESWPIGLSIAFNLVYLKGDVVILSLFRPEAEIGLYGAAYKVLDVVTVIPMVFMGLVMPVLANAWQADDRKLFKRRLSRAFDFMSMLALPLMLGAWAVGTDLMALIAGSDFAASGQILGILIIGAAMVFWGGLFGHTVVALGLQRKMIWAYAIDAAISFALYFLLVPEFGAKAAAWITVFSEAFIALATMSAVLWKSGWRPRLGITVRCLLASALMYMFLVRAAAIHVAVLVPLGALVYFGVLFLLGGLQPRAVRRLLSREL